jgi:hypothetical protein
VKCGTRHGWPFRCFSIQLNRPKYLFLHSAIVAGASEKSMLVQRILSKDRDELMPPPEAHKDLTPAQIATLQRGIAEGAPWGKHWAFTPLASGA